MNTNITWLKFVAIIETLTTWWAIITTWWTPTQWTFVVTQRTLGAQH
jgi:hypothetical protein